MTEKERLYLYLGGGIVLVLVGIVLGIRLVSKKEEGKNWSKRGVVIRFDW